MPGKDSYRYRTAGAAVVGILSRSMSAVFLPTADDDETRRDRYVAFAPLFEKCDLVLVEGDSQTPAPKIEVWRAELGSPPLARNDRSVRAVVTDNAVDLVTTVLPRSDVVALADWILNQAPAKSALR